MESFEEVKDFLSPKPGALPAVLEASLLLAGDVSFPKTIFREIKTGDLCYVVYTLAIGSKKANWGYLGQAVGVSETQVRFQLADAHEFVGSSADDKKYVDVEFTDEHNVFRVPSRMVFEIDDTHHVPADAVTPERAAEALKANKQFKRFDDKTKNPERVKMLNASVLAAWNKLGGKPHSESKVRSVVEQIIKELKDTVEVAAPVGGAAPTVKFGDLKTNVSIVMAVIESLLPPGGASEHLDAPVEDTGRMKAV